MQERPRELRQVFIFTISKYLGEISPATWLLTFNPSSEYLPLSLAREGRLEDLKDIIQRYPFNITKEFIEAAIEHTDIITWIVEEEGFRNYEVLLRAAVEAVEVLGNLSKNPSG